MDPVLQRNVFFVKEHVGLFKAASNFDILEPETGTVLMECREEGLGFFTKALRFTDYKRMTPFDIRIKTREGRLVVRVKRGVSLFLSKVEVLDESDRVVGGFQQKFFSIGGKFDVQDAAGQTLCTLQGKWSGWDFKFVRPDGVELAQVTKKWAGLGKEMFTSADNYVLAISDRVPAGDPSRLLILAAVMCIDMVLKE
jgi:uncharacterized protein YxjI